MKEKKEKGMSEIVKTVTSLVMDVIAVFGIYIVFYGHLSPGGGFAGGLIIAFLFILLFLAHGQEDAIRKLPYHFVRRINYIGLTALFILFIVALYRPTLQVNLWEGKDFTLLSGGIIPPLNIAVWLKVGAGIFMVFVALSVFKRGEKK